MSTSDKRPAAGTPPGDGGGIGGGPSEDRLQEMARQGLIRLGPRKLPDDFWELPRAKDPDGLVLRALLEERAEGW